MIVGVDIGGTKTLLARFEGDKPRDEIRFETPKNYDDCLKKLIEAAKTYKSHGELDRLVIAVAGRVDRRAGKIIACGNLPWQNAALGQDLQLALGVSVKLENDANVAALYEGRRGAGKGLRRQVYITLSTGIGVGVTNAQDLDESLLDAEIGHMVVERDGQLQLWEKTASAAWFMAAHGIKADDCRNKKIWADYAERLMPGISAITAMIQPSGIVFGGRMAPGFHFFGPMLSKLLEETYLASGMVTVPHIIAAQEPDNAVLLGTLELVKDKPR